MSAGGVAGRCYPRAMELGKLAKLSCAALVAAAMAGDCWAGKGRSSGSGRSFHSGSGTHHHGGHRFHGRTAFFVGGAFFYPSPYFYYPPPVYYDPPAPVYIEQQPYWYYCPEAAAYYPYVNECPGGWQPVVPSTPPPLG
jgi:hypothetical protein